MFNELNSKIESEESILENYNKGYEEGYLAGQNNFCINVTANLNFKNSASTINFQTATPVYQIKRENGNFTITQISGDTSVNCTYSSSQGNGRPYTNVGLSSAQIVKEEGNENTSSNSYDIGYNEGYIAGQSNFNINVTTVINFKNSASTTNFQTATPVYEIKCEDGNITITHISGDISVDCTYSPSQGNGVPYTNIGISSVIVNE